MRVPRVGKRHEWRAAVRERAVTAGGGLAATVLISSSDVCEERAGPSIIVRSRDANPAFQS